ncbi:uncharacterized protein [Typha latifolia]|uniref:uncharacterized protein isoform X2 n=1 Tax=Typha latifolia TaxID=4733 RepID=UPI003C2CFB88
MTDVKKKGSISEDDVSVLLQRYTATTILALLQEVSQFAGVKIDWNSLVKRSTTGITNAREYQMLWRHLAYKDALLEKVDDSPEPLDDDSDLEFELEAVPSVSAEASSDVAACVKALISSGSPRELGPSHRTSLDAPLTLHTPNDQVPRAPSDKQQLARNARGNNTAAIVSYQKQSLPSGTSVEALDGNALVGSSAPPKKKRKLWTEEEDLELIAAVQKCGEGNWSSILKGDFKHDRTASQLSQRWGVIRKRQALLNQSNGTKSTSLTSSEERKAAQKAFSLALDMPMTRGLSSNLSGTTHSMILPNSSALPSTLSEATPASTPKPQVSNQAASDKTSSPLNKPRTTLKKPLTSTKASVGSSSLIKAAAFAAGGRIAAPSTAASLFKAAQSKIAVHIRPRGGSITKSLITNPKPSTATNISGQQPANARYVRRGNELPPPVASSGTPSNLSVHGTEPAQVYSEKPVSNPSTSCSAPADIPAQETSGFVATCEHTHQYIDIDVDALLSDDFRDEDMMDLDSSVAEDHRLDVPSLDMGEIEKDASQGQAIIDDQTCPKDNDDSTVGTQAVPVGTVAAEKQIISVGADGAQIPNDNSTGLLNQASIDSRCVDSANVHGQTVDRQLMATPDDDGDKTMSLEDQHKEIKDIAVGNRSIVDDQAGKVTEDKTNV